MFIFKHNYFQCICIKNIMALTNVLTKEVFYFLPLNGKYVVQTNGCVYPFVIRNMLAVCDR